MTCPFQTKGYLVHNRTSDLRGFQAPSSKGVQLGQRAALYCRVSTADQSCERQERDLHAFAKRSGFEIIGVHKEKASGTKTDRVEREKVLALAQAREIDAILVTELSRWGRSTIDLVQTLQSLQAWDVSVLAISGLQFDLSTPHGKMIAAVMAALAEFERDLIRERIRSGIAAAKARGKQLGRQPGQRPSDRKATKVITLAKQGLSYRLIARQVGLSKNTVGAIIQRAHSTVPNDKANQKDFA
jgi:putative DNA-invertase from lambdoid prophage Rac